jgi:hypothetical protein
MLSVCYCLTVVLYDGTLNVMLTSKECNLIGMVLVPGTEESKYMV